MTIFYVGKPTTGDQFEPYLGPFSDEVSALMTLDEEAEWCGYEDFDEMKAAGAGDGMFVYSIHA